MRAAGYVAIGIGIGVRTARQLEETSAFESVRGLYLSFVVCTLFRGEVL